MTAPYRPYSHLSLSALVALARGVTSAQAMEAALLPPKDEPRDVQDAARVAVTHNEKEQ